MLTSGTEDIKKTISPPFDFHHVTHTRPNQFESLDRGSQNELITEFIAVRAAQRPKSQLQGIQANDLRDKKSGKLVDAAVKRPTTRAKTRSRTPANPPKALILTTPPPSPGHPRTLRSSPSIENFSRPAPWSPRSPTSPPPRTSSRNALRYPPLPEDLSNEQAAELDATPSLSLSDYPTKDARQPVTHAITTVDNAARPLKTSPLPTPSRTTIEVSTSDDSARPDPSTATEPHSSTILPLRHAHSFPAAKIFSEYDQRYPPDTGKVTAELRPESLQPVATGHWEDVVDFCYELAAESDCNFDWSQKTIYVGGDVDSTDTLASDHQVEELPSRTDEQSQNPLNRGSRPCPGAFRPPRVAPQQSPHSRPHSQKSAAELEESIAPFGRHQSPSDFRGYQHVPQPHNSKTAPQPYIASDEHCLDREGLFSKDPHAGTEFELPMVHDAANERCYSGDSSSFRGSRPALSKYSSDGSMLSSTTSTIRTYRSSNSIGSMPDLVYSLNNSRESVMADRTHAIRVTSSPGMPSLSVPPRFSNETGRLVIDRSRAPGPPLVSHSGQDAKASPQAPQRPRRRLPDLPNEIGKSIPAPCVRNNTKALPALPRKRSASASVRGQHGTTRTSYSLFPPHHCKTDSA
jgi:hypothetical protein